MDECLMILYCAIVCQNSVPVYNNILSRMDYFKLRPQLHVVFQKQQQDNQFFYNLQMHPDCTSGRQRLDMVVLKASLEKDLQFMTSLVLDRALLTPQMLLVLLEED
jgi:hypothetical protein